MFFFTAVRCLSLSFDGNGHICTSLTPWTWPCMWNHPYSTAAFQLPPCQSPSFSRLVHTEDYWNKKLFCFCFGIVYLHGSKFKRYRRVKNPSSTSVLQIPGTINVANFWCILPAIYKQHMHVYFLHPPMSIIILFTPLFFSLSKLYQRLFLTSPWGVSTFFFAYCVQNIPPNTSCHKLFN